MLYSDRVSQMNSDDHPLKVLETEIELMERHTRILKHIIENSPIGITKISENMSIPPHKVRYSLRVLEKEKLITATAHGAVASERVEKFLPELKDFLSRLSTTIKKIEKDIDQLCAGDVACKK